MKRVFHPYQLWEDHKHGMFQTTCKDEPFTIIRCKRLLSDPRALYKYMIKASTQWKFSAEMNLSNRSRNRQAWLGQAACCYYCGAPEYITKMAWHELTDEQRNEANRVADKVILEWEQSYANQAR